MPPGDRDAGDIEQDEDLQRRFGTSGEGDRRAVALGNEEAAVGAQGAGKTQHLSLLNISEPPRPY